MNLTFEQIITLVTLIGAGIAWLVAKPTLEAFIKFGDWCLLARERRLEMEAKQRKLRMEEKQLEDELQARSAALDQELNDKGYKIVVRRQDRRITELERDHQKCREDFATLSVRCENLDRDFKTLESNYRVVTQRLEILAPGIGNASDSKTARFFQRLAARKNKKLSESGEIDLGREQS